MLRATRSMPQLALLAAALLLSPAAGAQQSPTATVLRVAPPARLVSGKKPAALLPSKSVAPGNRINTGPNGRAALKIGGGVLTLGGDSDLFLHSTAAGETAAIARLALTQGAVRVQVSHESDQPLDLRLNVGALRLRALGADLWAAAETRGETVCLIAGEVEIDAEFGTERLDNPGDCLFFSAQNRRLVLKPDAAETMARKLERTAFATDVAMGLPAAAVPSGPRTQPEGGDGGTPQNPVAVRTAEPPPPENTFEIVAAPPPPAPPEPEPIAPVPAPPAATVSVAPPAPPAEPAKPAGPAGPAEPVEPAMALAMAVGQDSEPAPAPAAPGKPPAAKPAPKPAPAAAPGGGWLIVVASAGNGEAAARHAVKLQQAGVAAAVREGNGKFRVVVGPFPTREKASEMRGQLQYQLKVNDLWLLPNQ